MSKASIWWLYIIETDKGLLYTGITTDKERRFKEHCAVADGNAKAKAKGAKYFRANKPVSIVYSEQYKNRSEASKREAVVKKMSKADKCILVGAS